MKTYTSQSQIDADYHVNPQNFNYKKPTYQGHNLIVNNGSVVNSGGGSSASGGSSLTSKAFAGYNEAKQKSEQAKSSALSGFSTAESFANSANQRNKSYFQSILGQLESQGADSVSSKEKNLISSNLTSRQASDAQATNQMFHDPYSGKQASERFRSASGADAQNRKEQAGLDVDIEEANRSSFLEYIKGKSDLGSLMSNLDQNQINTLLSVAQGKSLVQRDFQYDPMAQLLQFIGESQGYSGSNSGSVFSSGGTQFGGGSIKIGRGGKGSHTSGFSRDKDPRIPSSGGNAGGGSGSSGSTSLTKTNPTGRTKTNPRTNPYTNLPSFTRINPTNIGNSGYFGATRIK